MNWSIRRLTLIGFALALLVILGSQGALAQGPDVSRLLDNSGLVSVLILLIGTGVLMLSVELLIHAIVRTAIRFQVSAFMLAILFSGVDFDNFSFALFTTARELENVAFGLAIGNAISVLGITLALGAFVLPFDIEVPRVYLTLFVVAPFFLFPLLLIGSTSVVSGSILLILFFLIFSYIVQHEREADRVFMQSDEVMEVLGELDVEEDVRRAVENRDEDETVGEILDDRDVDSEVIGAVAEFEADETEEGVIEEFFEELLEQAPPSVRRLSKHPWFWPMMLVVAVAGITAGGEGAAAGAEGILQTWDLTGTFLGVSLITILYTIDDTMLVVEPLRLGYSDIAIGGVLGVYLFNLTATVGMISVIQPITFRPETLYVHFTSLLIFTGITAAILWRGNVRRWHGVLLFGLYLLYLLINIQFLATGTPVSG